MLCSWSPEDEFWVTKFGDPLTSSSFVFHFVHHFCSAQVLVTASWRMWFPSSVLRLIMAPRGWTKRICCSQVICQTDLWSLFIYFFCPTSDKDPRIATVSLTFSSIPHVLSVQWSLWLLFKQEKIVLPPVTFILLQTSTNENKASDSLHEDRGKCMFQKIS